MNEPKAIQPMGNIGPKKESYSYETESNGVRKSVRIRQVENGWIVSVNKSWNEKDDKGVDQYQYEDKEYISSKDPRGIIEKKKEDTEYSIIGSVNSMMESIANLEGMLVV
jgi:hypothetical protein